MLRNSLSESNLIDNNIRLEAISKWAECESGSAGEKPQSKYQSLYILTNNVPACSVELPMSQCVGVALSPNSVINNGAERTRPLQSQIAG